jgi:predicted GIY-YIG superfamily endonuclease
MMFYVYVLISGADGGFYTGSTGDLKHRRFFASLRMTVAYCAIEIAASLRSSQ